MEHAKLGYFCSSQAQKEFLSHFVSMFSSKSLSIRRGNQDDLKFSEQAGKDFIFWVKSRYEVYLPLVFKIGKCPSCQAMFIFHPQIIINHHIQWKSTPSIAQDQKITGFKHFLILISVPKCPQVKNSDPAFSHETQNSDSFYLIIQWPPQLLKGLTPPLVHQFHTV